MRGYVVYIMASSSRTLYVGITVDLARRVAQHRHGKSRFTRSYRITRLVYWEPAVSREAAAARERQIKGLDRRRRVAIVESMNPRWDDLAVAFFSYPFGTPETFLARLSAARAARRRKFGA